MTDDDARQARYQATRPKPAGLPPLRTFRIIEANGNERTERFVTILDAARAYPDAWVLADVEHSGGFW
jgi:hypothetical protein